MGALVPLGSTIEGYGCADHARGLSIAWVPNDAPPAWLQPALGRAGRERDDGLGLDLRGGAGGGVARTVGAAARAARAAHCPVKLAAMKLPTGVKNM